MNEFDDDDLSQAILNSLRENYRTNETQDFDDQHSTNIALQAGVSREEEQIQTVISASLTEGRRGSLRHSEEVRSAAQASAGITDAEVNYHNSRVLEQEARIAADLASHVEQPVVPTFFSSQLLRDRQAAQKKLDEESLKWTCCEVVNGIRRRDPTIMETLRNCTKNGKSDRYPVFDSIKKQHLDCLAMIISKYPKMIYLRDHSGFPPLCQAAYTDFKDGCELILRYSEAAKNPFSDEPLLNYSNYRQETPLFLAVESQNLEVVMFLMQAGASAVHPCIRGWTPLHEAASKKSAQIMTHLLMSGVDLDTSDCFGVTPLFTAVISGSHECARLLLERGADVDNGRSSFSENPATPLHEAARRGDLKMCQILLEHGADPNALDKRNRAPIHLAAQGDFIAIVGELTRVTNKRRICRESGLSPLISCLEDANENYYTMELLLEDGWDPNQCINNDVQLRYKDGRKTALYFAVLNNNEDAVELLLQYGAKVDLDPLKCITVAVGISNFDIFDMLLLHGADIHEVNINVGDFPTTFASALSDHRFITRLLEMGLDADYFFKCPFGEKEHPSYDDLIKARTPIPWCVKMQSIKNTSMPSWLVPYIFKFSGRNNVELCRLTKEIIDEDAYSQINKMRQKPAPLKHLSRNAFVKACRPKLQRDSFLRQDLPKLPCKVLDQLQFKDIKW